MKLNDNIERFYKYLKLRGFSYAVFRACRYAIFLVRIRIFKTGSSPLCSIETGLTKLAIFENGVKIYSNGIEITKNVGLNVGISVFSAWQDSSKALWQLLKKDSSSFKVKISFKDLSMVQIWTIKLENEQVILWNIEMQIKESIAIDEIRIISVLNPNYKSWINNFHEEDFFRFNNRWHSLCLSDIASSLVGTRFPLNSAPVKSFIFENLGEESELLPIVQMLPRYSKAYLLGFRHVLAEDRKEFSPGAYHVFSGAINLLNDDTVLEDKLEKLRQAYFRSEASKRMPNNQTFFKQQFTVFLANLPWQNQGMFGVRAGSRWPHIKNYTEKDYMPFPFFLAYSASLLERNDFKVFCVDALAEEICENDFINRVTACKPDLFIAEVSTPSLENDLRILRKLPKSLAKVLCGPEFNIRNPEFLKKHEFIDYVIIGEYEFPLLKLAESLREKTPLDKVGSLIYRKDTKIQINPRYPLIENLDSLPWPMRKCLPMHKYNDCPGGIPQPSAQILASRGCPFGCSFCVWPQLMFSNNSYRVRSVKDVVDEMEYLVETLKFRSIYFDDDTFNIGKERMTEFAHEIKQRRLEGKLLDVPFAIMARFDLMDKGILEDLREAGLAAVKYGVESASQNLLDGMRKKTNLSKLKEIVSLTKDLGINTHLTFMFGFPEESKETIQATIDFALELNPYTVQFSIATPFPGTAYFSELKKFGFILTERWSCYDGNYRAPVRTKFLQAHDLVKAKIRADKIWRNHAWQRKALNLKHQIYYIELCNSLRNNGLIITILKINYFILFKLKLVFSSISKLICKKDSNRYLYKTARRMSFKRIYSRYLEFLGIFDGRFAYTGPRCVQIDLTDKCNNDCIGCWCNSPLLKDKKDKQINEIEFKTAINLIDELASLGTQVLYFSGAGEPFMYPRFLEVVEHAKKRKMTCSINTNFTLISDEVIKRLIVTGVDYLTVSVWAASPEVYKATHPNKDDSTFFHIQDSLVFLNKIKHDTFPFVKLYNVIFNLNYSEIEKMVDFAKETNSDAVEFAVIDSIPGATDKLLLSGTQRNHVLEQCSMLMQKYNNGHKKQTRPCIFNLEHFMRRISNSDSDKADYDSQQIGKMPCYAGWLFARVMPDGSVNSCLKSHRFPVGNVYKNSFKDIWNSSKQFIFREKTVHFDINDPFFSLIGNDTGSKVGCYKSCDNISDNILTHDRIRKMNTLNRSLLRNAARISKSIRTSRKAKNNERL